MFEEVVNGLYCMCEQLIINEKQTKRVQIYEKKTNKKKTPGAPLSVFYNLICNFLSGLLSQ